MMCENIKDRPGTIIILIVLCENLIAPAYNHFTLFNLESLQTNE